jgi:hypothetical protein
MAKGLPVVLGIPKQREVAAVGLDVVDVGSRRDVPLR